MYPFTFQAESGRPIYQQLYRYIVAEIASNRLREGEKMPSKRALAAHLRISQTTVESAYTMLITEGYLITRPRSGTYVARVEQMPVTAKTEVCFSTQLEKPTQVSSLYHFRTNAVDTSLFPYATWLKIQREVLQTQKELLNHGDTQGDVALREALCKYLHEYRGVNCAPEQIVIGAGLEYLLGLLCTLLGPQSVFALEDPGYPAVRQVIHNHGRRIVDIPVGAQGIDVDLLETRNAGVAYITPSHQFPTGVTMPISARMRLLAWAHRQEGRYIIEDDYDSEFRYVGRPIPSLQGLDTQGKVIYLGTFSRSLAPSIRIAYIILPQALLSEYRRVFSLYSSTVSRFEQHTLARFIAQGHYTRHLNRARNLYRRRKDCIVSALRTSPAASHLEIQGENAGLHFLLRVHGLGEEHALLRRAEALGVRAHGLAEYVSQPLRAKGAALVLGYAGLSEEEIQAAVSLLSRALLTP